MGCSTKAGKIWGLSTLLQLQCSKQDGHKSGDQKAKKEKLSEAVRLWIPSV